MHIERIISRYAQLTDAPKITWTEDRALRSRFTDVSVVHGGYLWGQGIKPSTTGVLATDLRGTRVGGKPIGVPRNVMWSDGTSLYLQVPATRVNAHYRTKSGPFTQGELCTQETSGATGRFSRDASGTLYLQSISGTFAAEAPAGSGSHTITGGTSGATAEIDAVTTTANCMFLQRSATGFEDFVVVHDWVSINAYPRGFVDCGVIAGLGNKHLLLIITIGSATNPSEIYYNYPADGTTWTKLLDTEVTPGVSSVTHFHGAVFASAVNNGATQSLFVFTGDGTLASEGHSGVLRCDDVTDLVTNPSTWKTHWGLGLLGQARTDWLTTGAGAPYSIGMGEQYKLLDLVLDENQRYGYAIPDATNANVKTLRIDLVDGSSAGIGTAPKGVGWVGLRTSDNAILFCAGSEFFGGVYVPSSDTFIRVYQLNASRTDMIEVCRDQRGDVAAPSGLVYHDAIVEYPPASGIVWVGAGNPALWISRPRGGTIVARTAPIGRGAETLRSDILTGAALPPLTNLIKNGRFAEVALTSWTLSHCAAAQSTTVVDVASGALYSVAITPDAGTDQACIWQLIPPALVRAIAGNWITVVCRMLWPAASGVADVGMYVNAGVPANVRDYRMVKSDTWQTQSIELFLSPSTTAVGIELYGRLSGNSRDVTYFSDLRVVLGAVAEIVPRNLPSREAMIL